MKTEVNLCDECKERISVKKCDLCNCDLCTNHIASANNVNVAGQIFGILYFCSACKRKYFDVRREAQKGSIGESLDERIGFYDSDFQKKIFNQIKTYVKGKIIAGEL